MSVVIPRLRDVIKNIRAAKTAAEERGIVAHECALIKNLLGSSSTSSRDRARCIVKLTYFSMLGYPTEFAQMHVVKMLAEPDFTSKRVAHLALSIMLDERQEVLTLAENHLKNDITNTSPFIQALALDVVANVAGEDMSRDVLQDVAGALTSSNAHVRRKACLAATRIVRKVPDAAEAMLVQLIPCMADRNNAVLMTALTAVVECLERCPSVAATYMPRLREKVPAIVQVLKRLVLSPFATEYDILDVTDPFLQCAVLRFFRVVGAGDAAASEAMSDILAQVATNTDGQKNVGCAVLYECVRTIGAVEADDGLRVLGVNILGRSVVHRDNNVRYIALSALRTWIKREHAAVKRHLGTILECLKDPDVSLRRKAIELTVALVDHESVRSLVPDLLAYLTVCSPELRRTACEHLCTAIETYAPTAEWRIEMSMRLIKHGETAVPHEFAARFLAHVSRQTPELKTRAVTALWDDCLSLPLDAQQQQRPAALTCSVWLAGEYLGLLMRRADGKAAAAEQVVERIVEVASEASSREATLYALTALAKIGAVHKAGLPQIRALFEATRNSFDCELQQRAGEYLALLDAPAQAAEALGAMPPMPEAALASAALPQLNSQMAGAAGPGSAATTALPATAAAATSRDPLGDIFGAATASTTASAPRDPLADIFGTGGSSSANKTMSNALFEAAEFQAAPVMQAAPRPVPFEVFKNSDVIVSMAVEPTGTDARHKYERSNVEVLMRAAGAASLSEIEVLIAVPRGVAIEVLPTDATTVAANGTAQRVQRFRLDCSGDPAKGSFMQLKVKLLYTAGTNPRTQGIFQVARDL